MLGLSKEELEELGFSADNIWGPPGQDLPDMMIHVVKALRDETIELILKNNERIKKQLSDAGLLLDD